MTSSNGKPRIVFVGAFPKPGREIYGGVLSSCTALLASELPQHVEFTLIDSTQVSNPPPSLPKRLLLAVSRFLKFCICVVRDRPDAALIFVSTGASIVEKGTMAWFARACKVPVLLFPRAGEVIQIASRSSVVLLVVRLFLKPASILLCQSQVWKNFARIQLRIPDSRLQVIENWTASPEFLAIGAKRLAEPISDRAFRLIFVGWVEREKGILDLLEACSRLHQTLEFVLQIAGDGSAREVAEKMARDYGIADRVKFLGWLPVSSLRTALGEADAFVLPSWAEGLPNAMIEAMATRLPVVVTRVGGIPDVIQDRVSGLLVEPQSPVSLADALRCIIECDDIRHAVADAGYVIAQQRFSRSAAVAEFKNAINLTIRSPVI